MTLVKRKDSLFPGIWSNFFENEWLDIPSANQLGSSMPAVNILDAGENYEIQIAAPGMKKDQFNVTLDDGLLTVSTEQVDENQITNQQGRYTHREFNYFSFKRSFNLPETVDRENVSANYQDGVLTVFIPKFEQGKKKQMKMIEVK